MNLFPLTQTSSPTAIISSHENDHPFIPKPHFHVCMCIYIYFFDPCFLDLAFTFVSCWPKTQLEISQGLLWDFDSDLIFFQVCVERVLLLCPGDFIRTLEATSDDSLSPICTVQCQAVAVQSKSGTVKVQRPKGFEPETIMQWGQAHNP